MYYTHTVYVYLHVIILLLYYYLLVTRPNFFSLVFFCRLVNILVKLQNNFFRITSACNYYLFNFFNIFFFLFNAYETA